MAAARPVIAVDMDEVLCGTHEALVNFHNERFATKLTLKDFNSYAYHEVWGGTTSEAVEKVRLFYDSDHFENRMQPVPGAVEALTKLKSHYSLIVVTSRQEFVHEATHSFINTHFPNIFDEIHFANHHLTPEESKRLKARKKSEVCKEIGAAVLIDDALVHAKDCGSAGIRVFLFDHEGAYMWNKLPEGEILPENVTRVHSWEDVVAALVPKA
ncbi:HAD-like domain-containing protein [Zopfochytrium polystomum]|nr:HAD-like domain-containing protein [Zopfochytrium polystomum]